MSNLSKFINRLAPQAEDPGGSATPENDRKWGRAVGIVVCVIWVCLTLFIFFGGPEKASLISNGKAGRVVGRSNAMWKGNYALLRIDHWDSVYYCPRRADLRRGDSVFRQNDTLWRVREIDDGTQVAFITSYDQ